MNTQKKLSNWKDNVKETRKSLHITQDTMANAVKVSPRTYKRIENGETVPTLDVALNISDILKKPIAELCTEQQ